MRRFGKIEAGGLPSIPFAIMAGEYEENFIFHHSTSKKFVVWGALGMEHHVALCLDW